MASLDAGMFVNFALSLLLRKIVVPSDYESQVKAVKEMQMDDMSGLIDSLTDFAVESATVDFAIETDNPQFTKILKKWLDRINLDYPQIPSGVKELAREYFKERWKYSSFPILKISKWEEMDGISVPTKMFFVDGQSIKAFDIDNEDDLKVTNYDYYIGSKKERQYKLGDNCIFARPYGRWFDKYPVPYLIKRGVYHNWKIIQSLKNMQSKILDQVIPYILLIKKGSEGLATQNIKTYSNTELREIIEDFQELMNEIKSTKIGEKSIKSNIRVTNFDEEIKHLIPDLSTIFDSKLFAQAERNILSGLGFIDVIQGISDTRRESILNPKAFVTEIKSGVEGFKGILKELVFLIQEQNESHKKYVNGTFYVTASPVNAFMTDAFKQEIRLLWKHGQLSNRTYCELVGETEYQTEIHRREKEAKEGTDVTMYPHVTDNREGQGIDIPGEEPTSEDEEKTGKPKDRDKIDDKEKFSMSKTDLEGSPYPTIESLPPAVKKLSPKKQKTFMKAWNRAYYYKLAKTGDKKMAETYAFKVAWSLVKSKKRSKIKKEK